MPENRLDSLRERTRERRSRFGTLGQRLGRDQGFDFEFTDQERQGLLGQIGGKTIGSLYKFANVLDLPVSSVRDVLAGENPFDQWLTPTKDENRVQMRDLMRKHGLISRKDTWGNLAGSIAADIALDPLTYLGSGTSALTKHGKLLKQAGVLDQLPSYIEKLNLKSLAKGSDDAAGQAAKLSGKRFPGQAAEETLQGAAQMGRREALQNVTDAKQILDSIDDPLLKADLAKKLDQTAGRFGYENYADFLGKEGQEGLKSAFRFGLPEWRLFGADKMNKFQSSPGVLVGKAGSEGMKKFARAQDVLGQKVFHNWLTDPISTNAKALLDRSVLGMTTRTGQIAAKAGHARMQLADSLVKEAMSDLTTEMDVVADGAWTKLKNVAEDEMADKHEEIRNYIEFTKNATPEQKVTADRIDTYLDTALQRLKERGVAVEGFEDDFIERYLPRKLTEFLRNDMKQGMDALKGDPSDQLVTNVFSEHFLGRSGLFTDIEGGTSALNKMFRDPQVWKLLRATDVATNKKIKDLSRYLKQKYNLPEKFRGKSLSREGTVAEDEAARFARVHDERTFADIEGDPSLTDREKVSRIQAKLENDKDFQVRMAPSWAKEAEGRVGRKILDKDRVFDLKKDRHLALAHFMNDMAPRADELEKYGLFGNNPMWDLETYLQKTEDSVQRADVVYNVLSTPGSLVENVHMGQQGKTVGAVFKELGFNVDEAVDNLAKRLGMDSTSKDYDNMLKRLKNKPVEIGINKDLERYDRFFKAPESAQFFGKVMDSSLAAFKANVTAPFPAFHMRNLMSGQFRNAVAGSWDVQSMKEAGQILHGKDIEGAENIPYLKQRWEQIQRSSSSELMRNKELDNKEANRLLRAILGESELVGAYGGDAEGLIGDVANIGAAQIDQITAASKIKSMAPGMMARRPGEYAFSWKHVFKSLMGRTKRVKKVRQPDGTIKEVAEATTETGLPQIFPFPVWDMPFWAGRKLTASPLEKAGAISPERAAKWKAEGFFRMPRELRTRGMYERAGLQKDAKLLHEGGRAVKDYGPIAAGMEVGHVVEGMNRVAPMLYKLRKGMDPTIAAAEVVAQQVPYGSKYYTPFENTYLKRIFPFYSFSSRSMPWAIRKFMEQPGNKLTQVIRGTTSTGEHLQAKHQEQGPVPPYLRDTLAIPVPYKGVVEGTKRFFTGADVMSQDLWQLGMPILSGDWSEAGFELAGRSRPGIKKAIEAMTGVSMHQRGVEGGRPLRSMDPPIGRTLSNISQTWSKLTGEPVPADYYKKLERDSLLEKAVADSHASRYIASVKVASDVRKGLGAKALRLLMGAGVTDVSPRAQEAILREYLRSMIAERGGTVFEKATFTKDQLAEFARTDPAKLEEALQLKALNDERAKIAKLLKEKSAMNLGY